MALFQLSPMLSYITNVHLSKLNINMDNYHHFTSTLHLDFISFSIHVLLPLQNPFQDPFHFPTPFCFLIKFLKNVAGYFFFNLFTCFWLHQVFVAVLRLRLVVVSRGCSWLRFTGFSQQWILLQQSSGSRRTGFSYFNIWAQQLWHMGLVGQNPCALHWQVDSYPLYRQGSPSLLFL